MMPDSTLEQCLVGDLRYVYVYIRGFAFVTFRDPRDADDSLELDGTYLLG